jgi:hypothetical protein
MHERARELTDDRAPGFSAVDERQRGGGMSELASSPMTERRGFPPSTSASEEVA